MCELTHVGGSGGFGSGECVSSHASEDLVVLEVVHV
jgi:hypothetical protein